MFSDRDLPDLGWRIKCEGCTGWGGGMDKEYSETFYIIAEWSMKDVRKKGGVYLDTVHLLWYCGYQISPLYSYKFVFFLVHKTSSYQLQIFWLDSFSGKCAALTNFCVVSGGVLMRGDKPENKTRILGSWILKTFFKGWIGTYWLISHSF